MPWWSWLLIWSGLVIGLLMMLILFGVMLFRKLMTVVDALGDLGDQVSSAGAANVPDTADEVPTARALPAVFQSRVRLAEIVADRRFERLHQRQLRHDRAIHHGKLFGTFPVIPKDSSHAQ